MWIQCFEEDEEYLMLPIGLETTLREICESYHVRVESVDKRFVGQPIDVMFHGDLREKQVKAVEEMLAVSGGILHANTAFGKPAKYKYGLTATLKRKDGKERIVLMQLGPVCYKDLSKVTSDLEHKVYVQETGIAADNLKDEYTTNKLYDYLYSNPLRNMQIVMDVRNCLDENRYPIFQGFAKSYYCNKQICWRGL